MTRVLISFDNIVLTTLYAIALRKGIIFKLKYKDEHILHIKIKNYLIYTSKCIRITLDDKDYQYYKEE